MSESLFEQYKAALRRGHMAALAGELEDALAAYDAAGRLVPERALPLASRGTVLHRLDRWPEAAEAFDQALQLAPDDEAALRARATARAERGLRSGAAADFERLAFVLDVAGRAPMAADAARRAAELEPTDARASLAARLGAAADQLVDLAPATAGPPDLLPDPSLAPFDGRATDETIAEDPWSAALDLRRLEALDDGDAHSDSEAEAVADTAADAEGYDPESAAAEATADADWTADAPAPHVRVSQAGGSATYDALEALRAGMDADEAAETDSAAGTAGAGVTDSGEATAAEEPIDELAPVAAAEGVEGASEDGGSWPGIDLPSPPPPPIEGPPPEPEDLLAEAALVLESGEIDAARDLMLTAARVHRDAGRIDAALEICLNLLTIAPGDPRVHLAIANLQLDRGWTGVATEKIDLLVRLTSLTGDTQAEADVHGLASERLRDDPAPTPAGR